MITTSTARRWAAASAGAALLAGTVLVATPASAADGPLTITGVGAENTGGGLTAYVPLYCSVAIDFSDPTPAATDRYGVTVTAVDGAVVLGEVFVGDGHDEDPTTFRASADCRDFTEGEHTAVTVTERAESGDPVATSDPAAYTLAYTGHPAGISDSSVLVDGRWTHTVGETQTIAFDGGEWEPGTKFWTQVWTSATDSFTGDDWAANVYDDAAIVDVDDADAPVLTWTPRASDAGRWAWISIVGKAPGKGGWQFWFSAHRIVAASTPAPQPEPPVTEPPVTEPPVTEPVPAAQPVRAWYRGFGQRRGAAKVGRTLAVTAPALTSAGRAAAVRVTYRWFVKRGAWKPLPGADARRSRYRVRPALRGKRLKVVATYAAPGHRDLTRTFAWPRAGR